MKKILLLFFILLSLSQARASDTLTIRQVYNFNVGDTFDYASTLKYQAYNADIIPPPYYGQAYSRYIIDGKTFSADSNTITYTRHQVYPIDKHDTLVYTNLDSNIFTFFRSQSPNQSNIFDSSHLPDGRLVDSLSYRDSLTFLRSSKYGAGLGLTYSLYDTSSYQTSLAMDTTLIYYAKDSDIWGTTFYQSIGYRLPHYTPIPEDCAYWNYTLQCPQLWSGGYSDGTIQQVRTGGKVYFNNHSYVELTLVTFMPTNNILTKDSVFGYFRNDTTGQKVYFTNSINSPEFLLYDFTLYTSAPTLGNNFLHLDTIIIGGITRVVWQDASSPLELNDSLLYYIEGIGAISGFPGQGEIWVGYYSFIDEGTDYCYEAPVLQSFCVCGETLYPDTTSSQCQLLTGINKIPNSSSPKVYPNPTSDLLHLSISDAGQYNTQFIITDILGQEVYSSPITQSETKHDISRLASGIYTWRVLENSNIIKTGKIIKQ